MNRITLMASAIAALVVSASAFLAHPGQAQTTAQATAQAKENECLRAPKGAPPKGSHWFYRLDRANGNRRCWYLGSESQKVRRAAPERKAAAVPAPAAESEAPLPRARTATRSVMPATDANAVDPAPANVASPANATANPSNATANAAAPSNVAAAGFSAAWPAAASRAPIAAGPSDREGATAAGAGNAEEATTTAAPEMAPAVSPAPASADAAAVGDQSGPAPGVGHVLLFLAALGGFVIIAIRAMVKMLSRNRERIEPRPAARRAAPIIRRRVPEQHAIDHIAEPATQDGRALRPLDIASRWDTASTRWDTTPRLPRTPNVPLYDDAQHDVRRVEDEARRLHEAAVYEQEGPALRRRRRVA